MFTLLITAIIATFYSDHWAVLVAGSSGFSNYRHQSDIFRSYQILTKNGFDTDKIIVMAYDDIATSPYNPYPGHVYNVPDGEDVYIGSDNIDYKGTNVTAKKFIAVMTGDADTAGGQVLESTSEDNVFVFFDDHGSYGLLSFPTGAYLYADDIQDMFETMYNKNMYNKLVWYIEACYSGSLFINSTIEDMRIYTMTAANATQSSYATYCGIAKYKTCLSNEFSQRWFEYSEAYMNTSTIGEEYTAVKEAVVESNVCRFGDTTIESDGLTDYQAGTTTSTESNFVKIAAQIQATGSRLSQPDTYLAYLSAMAEQDPAFIPEYAKAQALRKVEDQRAARLADYFGVTIEETSDIVPREKMVIYRVAIEMYENKYGRLNEFNFWPITTILYKAVASNRLTVDNFYLYVRQIMRY